MNLDAPNTPFPQPQLPELTPDQKAMVDRLWDQIPIAKLVRLVFANESLDGRTNEARAIKQYLAAKGQAAQTSQKVLVGEIVLTDSQKDFIRANSAAMKPLEMARALFPDVNVATLLQAEGRAVFKYAQEVRRETVSFWDEPVDTLEYRSPKSFNTTLGLANEYVPNNIDPSKSYYDFNNLKPFEIKCLKALQGYLKTTRVRFQAGLYEKKADRTLFESTMVRLTHDKPDLSQGDLDMFVAASSELVNMTREERKILRLEEQLDQILGGEGEERQKLSQAFVDLINQTRTKWDTSKARHKGYMESLESSRAKRNEHMVQRSQSVINLLEAWIKDEQTRNDIIALGEIEKNEDRDEVRRLTNMDGIVALIAGHTKQEAEN